MNDHKMTATRPFLKWPAELPLNAVPNFGYAVADPASPAAESDYLKRILPDTTAKSPNLYAGKVAGQTPQKGLFEYMKNLFERPVEKLQIVAGKGAAEDASVAEKVRHTMLKGESLMTWYARTGLSKAQALAMTRDEIAAFVALAEQNERPSLPTTFTEPPAKPEPRSIIVG